MACGGSVRRSRRDDKLKEIVKQPERKTQPLSRAVSPPQVEQGVITAFVLDGTLAADQVPRPEADGCLQSKEEMHLWGCTERIGSPCSMFKIAESMASSEETSLWNCLAINTAKTEHTRMMRALAC